MQGDALGTKRFYSDGVRGMGDVVTDPVLMNEEGDLVSVVRDL